MDWDTGAELDNVLVQKRQTDFFAVVSNDPIIPAQIALR